MATDRTISPSKTHPSPRNPKKRPSRAFWIKRLAEYSKSGLSAQEFCRRKNLAPSNFYTWRKRLREEESHDGAEPERFIPLEEMTADNFPVTSKTDLLNQEKSFSPDIEKERSDSGLSLRLNDRIKITIDKDFHGPTLQRLVQLFPLGNLSVC